MCLHCWKPNASRQCRCPPSSPTTEICAQVRWHGRGGLLAWFRPALFLRRQVCDVVPWWPQPADSVYIGHGHFRHRFPCAKWANPFAEGPSGSSLEIVLRFLERFPSSDLAQQLPEMSGMQLLCCSEPNCFCHWDVLVGAFNQVQVPRRLLLGLMAGLTIPFVACFQGSSATLARGRLLRILSLVNSPTFASFNQWISQSFPTLGPQILGMVGVILQGTGVQGQSGVENERFAASQIALRPWCDFTHTSHHSPSLPGTKWALRPVSEFLREQHLDVRRVNPVIHLALIAHSLVLLAWHPIPVTVVFWLSCNGLDCSMWFVGFPLFRTHPPRRSLKEWSSWCWETCRWDASLARRWSCHRSRRESRTMKKAFARQILFGVSFGGHFVWFVAFSSIKPVERRGSSMMLA